MKIDPNETLMLYTNLGPAEEPRRRVLNAFLDEEMPMERLAAMAPEWVKRAPAGQSRGSYAAGLTLRTAFREARKREAEAVLVLSDEAVPVAGFMEKLAALNLPRNSGMVLLSGVAPASSPEVEELGLDARVTSVPASPCQLLPVREFGDWTAVLVRRQAWRKVSRLLRKNGTGRVAWMPGQRCVVPDGLMVHAVNPGLVARHLAPQAGQPKPEASGQHALPNTFP